MSFENSCRHFNGINYETCEAGVKYADVRDPDGTFATGTLPCFKDRQGSIPCQHREWRTAEEIERENREVDRLVAEMVTRANNGLCVECGERPQYMEQVSRAYYAHPCGHRQGCGSAREWNKRWANNPPAEHMEMSLIDVEIAIEEALGDNNDANP